MMKNPLMKNAKDTVKLGVFSMGGIGIMGSMQGAMSNVSGIDAATKTGLKNTTGAVSSGLQLTNVGQLSKSGLAIAKMLGK